MLPTEAELAEMEADMEVRTVDALDTLDRNNTDADNSVSEWEGRGGETDIAQGRVIIVRMRRHDRACLSLHRLTG